MTISLTKRRTMRTLSRLQREKNGQINFDLQYKFILVIERTLIYFVRGGITVRLTSCLTALDSTKLVNIYLIQHKQSS